LGQESGGDGEVAFRGAVDPSELTPLLALLAALEAWEQRSATGAVPLDRSRATLRLRIGDARSRVWEYSSDLLNNDRLVRVRDALTALLGRARSLAAPRLGEAASVPAVDAAPL
jgi:hypothetical protein